MKLKDKVAIVTGGASGIGAAICRRYAAEGARVIVTDRLGVEAQKLAAEIGGGAIGVPFEATDRKSIDNLIATTVETAGRIDILVNNAATFDMAPILEITEQSYDQVFAVNVKGLLFTLQAAARQMVKQGDGGKVINMSSQAGRRGEALVAVYCASKAAVISLTQSAGLGLIEHKINVNGIAPGIVDTPFWVEVDKQFAKLFGWEIGEPKRKFVESIPLGRIEQPEDVTGAAIFLASAESDYMTQQTLNVDGGNWPG
jgi:NAD(P)-dependent dehydrogenase (short-subunit alcohol dehydrogenase family)